MNVRLAEIQKEQDTNDYIQKEQDTNDDIADEIYTISIYQTTGVGKLIKNRLADKNSLKETIQGYFKSLTRAE